MAEDSKPKVFISYSWSSDEFVLGLSQRLVSHGVDVVLDKWDLKEGQDKYEFMEQCVNNPEITKVLIVCDKVYEQKANDRAGGVGDETVIISSKVYGNTKQEKYIPIIVERHEDGTPCVPTYIKSRIYIDFSDPNRIETEYDKLIRNIWNRPLYVKPKLGRMPEWLDEEKSSLSTVKDLIRQLRGSNTEARINSCIRRFQCAYVELIKEHFKKSISPEQAYETYLNTKTARDIYLEFVEAVAESDSNYAETIASCFETLYNQFVSIKTFDPKTNSASEIDLEPFKILIWELFVCVIAFMRNAEDYAAINIMLENTYFLETNIWGGRIEPQNYTAFRHYSRVIEELYKPQTDNKNLLTLVGNTVCTQRERFPVYTGEAIAEADLFLYQVCDAFDFSGNNSGCFGIYWFPTCYVYVKKPIVEWGKMKSRKYCSKMMKLFGVDSIDALKEVVKRCKYDTNMKYNGSWGAAPAILSYIKEEDIGTLN